VTDSTAARDALQFHDSTEITADSGST